MFGCYYPKKFYLRWLQTPLTLCECPSKIVELSPRLHHFYSAPTSQIFQPDNTKNTHPLPDIAAGPLYISNHFFLIFYTTQYFLTQFSPSCINLFPFSSSTVCSHLQHRPKSAFRVAFTRFSLDCRSLNSPCPLCARYFLFFTLYFRLGTARVQLTPLLCLIYKNLLPMFIWRSLKDDARKTLLQQGSSSVPTSQARRTLRERSVHQNMQPWTKLICTKIKNK